MFPNHTLRIYRKHIPHLAKQTPPFFFVILRSFLRFYSITVEQIHFLPQFSPIRAAHLRFFVDNDPGHTLRVPSAKHARLLPIQFKSIYLQKSSDFWITSSGANTPEKVRSSQYLVYRISRSLHHSPICTSNGRMTRLDTVGEVGAPCGSRSLTQQNSVSIFRIAGGKCVPGNAF